MGAHGRGWLGGGSCACRAGVGVGGQQSGSLLQGTPRQKTASPGSSSGGRGGSCSGGRSGCNPQGEAARRASPRACARGRARARCGAGSMTCSGARPRAPACEAAAVAVRVAAAAGAKEQVGHRHQHVHDACEHRPPVAVQHAALARHGGVWGGGAAGGEGLGAGRRCAARGGGRWGAERAQGLGEFGGKGGRLRGGCGLAATCEPRRHGAQSPRCACAPAAAAARRRRT